MTRRFIFIGCVFFISLLALGCNGKSISTIDSHPTQTATAPPFIIAGSGTNLPVTTKLAQAYYTKTGLPIDVPGSIGSDGAINAVKSGNLELGLISKPLTPDDHAAGLQAIPYGRVAIIFGAHLNVPDSTLCDSDIISIINGSKTTWSDGSKIHVFVRQNNDSSNLALSKVIPGYKEALLDASQQHRWQTIYRDKDMSEAIKETKGTFGLTVSTETAKIDSKTKILNYNGISPTMENIRNGTYPLTEDLSFIYKKPLSNRAADFLDYVFSAEGRNIMDKWGSSPIER